MAELGFELWIGDPTEIKARLAKKQKTDRKGCGISAEADAWNADRH